jgi:membrane protease YdiL (CAAX protease family)
MSDDRPPADPVPTAGASDRMTIVLLAVAVEGGLIVLACALGWLLGKPPLETLKWDLRDAGRALAYTAPLLVLFWVLLRWPVGPLRGVKRFSVEVLCPALAPCTGVDLVGIAALAGLGEEMLFRGVLQGMFERWLGFGPALAAASVLFGALHAITPAYAVLAALMGAYLGWVWHDTENLLVPVLIHALYDGAVLFYLLRGPGRSLWDRPAGAPAG